MCYLKNLFKARCSMATGGAGKNTVLLLGNQFTGNDIFF